LILAEGLRFGYGRDEVLRGVDFEANEGEILSIVGPNGCGKTTLIRCLLGLLAPREGRVLLDGRPLTSYGRAELARTVAYVPQNHTPSFPYSVGEMVLMGRTAHIGSLSLPSRGDHSIAEEAMKTVGIDGLAGRPYTRLSGGESRLVLLARAIAQQPRILILDEPTAHLDVKNRLLVLGRIRALTKERRITTLMSLHEPNQALALSDRVLLMRNGSVAGLGEPSEVLSEKNMRDVYGVDGEMIRHKGRNFLLFETGLGGDGR